MRRFPLLPLCLAAAFAFAWPLPSRLDTVLRDRYDAQTQAWVVAWVGHALTEAPSELFQANAFAPARDVLAFSEPLLGYGVLGVPLRALGLSPAGVLNALCVLLLGVSAWSIARLAVDLGARPGAALVGAVAAAFGALTTVQLGFVSFTAFGGIAWMVLFGRRLLHGGTLRDAAALALATAVQGYFSLHFLAFGLGTLLVLSAVRLAVHFRKTLREAAPRMAAALAVAALLLLPLLVPLMRVRKNEGFQRSRSEMAEFSASPLHFACTTPWNPGQAFLPGRSGAEKALYPGTAALALALLGLVLPRRGVPLTGLAGTGALVAVTGALGAMGLNAPLWPALAFLAPPLFGGIRVTARFAFVLQIGMGLLAAWGASRLLALVRGRLARLAVAAGLLAVVAVDVRQAHPFSFRPPAAPSPADAFLARSFTGGGVLHLPLTHGPEEARLLYASTHGFPRIVNGTLSYVPVRHRALATRFSEGPLDAELLTRLEAWPVGAIVVHDHWLPLERRAPVLRFLAEGQAAGRLAGPVRFDHGSGADWVFGVTKNGAVALPSELARHDLAAEARAFGALVAGTRDLGWVEDPSLRASIDAPEEGTAVDQLVVRGWGLDRDGPFEVAETLVDGDRRPPITLKRTPRFDIPETFPGLGDPSAAGFALRLPRLPGDQGEALLTVRVLSRGGHVRTLHRTFSWR